MGYGMKNRLLIFVIIILSLSCKVAFAENLLHYRSLLLNHDFKQLEKELTPINNLPLNSRINIEKYTNVFSILYFDRDKYEGSDVHKAIEKWLTVAPNSAYAVLYDGLFFYDLGTEARGWKFIKDTPEENLPKMRAYFKKAEVKLLGSLKINPNLIAARRMLINLYSHVSHEAQKQFFLDSIAVLPDNYVIWHAHLFKTTPRWGGSYEQIYEYLKMAKKYFKTDPSIVNRLGGIVYQDTAKVLIYDKEYDKAMEVIDKGIAVSAGYPLLFRQRALIHSSKKDHKSCVIWSKKSLEASLNDISFLNTAAYCSHMAQNWKLSIDYNYRIIQQTGEDKYSLFRLGVAYMQLAEIKEAYTIFERLVEIDPTYERYIRNFNNYVETDHPNLTKFTMKGLKLFDFY